MCVCKCVCVFVYGGVCVLGSLHVCVFVENLYHSWRSVCVYGVCVCVNLSVCVCEIKRQREREREGGGSTHLLAIWSKV